MEDTDMDMDMEMETKTADTKEFVKNLTLIIAVLAVIVALLGAAASA
ncbi:MAG: hypothetical protein ACYYKD_04430 [Rhodospirillales bacterium]